MYVSVGHVFAIDMSARHLSTILLHGCQYGSDDILSHTDVNVILSIYASGIDFFTAL